MLDNDELVKTENAWIELAERTDCLTTLITYVETAKAYSNDIRKIQLEFGNDPEMFQRQVLKLCQNQEDVAAFGKKHLPT